MVLKKDVMKYIISFLFLLMLLIPIYEVFVPYENKPEKECWELKFIWEDFITLFSYFLFALFWLLNLKYRNNFLRILLSIFAIINLIGTFIAGIVPCPDLVFVWGTPVYAVLCLCVLFYIIKIINRKKSNVC